VASFFGLSKSNINDDGGDCTHQEDPEHVILQSFLEQVAERSDGRWVLPVGSKLVVSLLLGGLGDAYSWVN
jgi:hypothetical protein